MLKKLQIRNFQNQKRLTIEFDPAITTIVGPTDAGKSAVYRALKWLSSNRPKGNEFINWDSDIVSLCLDIDDSRLIRKKGKQNLYSIGPDEFKAFGSDVPDAVLDLLNISELNFQSQHDSPFWFSETAGEISRQLNAIVDLSSMDSSLANIAGEIRTVQAEVKVVDNRIREGKEQQDRLAFVPKMAQDFLLLEELETRIEHAEREVKELQALRDKVKQTQKEILYWENIATVGQVMINSSKAYNAKRVDVLNLTHLLNKGTAVTAIFNRKIPDTITIDALYKKIKMAQDEHYSLSSKIANFKTYKERIEKWEANLQNTLQEMAKLSKGQCLLCGQPMKK